MHILFVFIISILFVNLTNYIEIEFKKNEKVENNFGDNKGLFD